MEANSASWPLAMAPHQSAASLALNPHVNKAALCLLKCANDARLDVSAGLLGTNQQLSDRKFGM